MTSGNRLTLVGVALVGILLFTGGGLSTLVAGARISHDMTPKGIFGEGYAYGTTGHPELMTPHEWGMLIWLGGSVAVVCLGGLMTLGGGVIGVASISSGGERHAH